jgi:hypothetical protein
MLNQILKPLLSRNLALTMCLLLGCLAPLASLAADRDQNKSPTAPRDAQEPAVAEGSYLTTKQGQRVEDDDNSLKAGSRGPTLIEDFHFLEKMTQFDHERMPERVVHARGSGAHGYFQVYKPLGRYTKAAVFQDPGVKTLVSSAFQR